MNKQEFLNQISAKGKIDISKIPTKGAPIPKNQWFILQYWGIQAGIHFYPDHPHMPFISILNMDVNPPKSIYQINFLVNYGGPGTVGAPVSTLPDGVCAFAISKLLYAKKPEAEGKITMCKINGVHCPLVGMCDAGNANSGDEILVECEMGNIGGTTGAFRFYIIDENTSAEIIHIPTTTRHVASMDLWKPAEFKFVMPSKEFKGRLELRKYE